MAKMIPLSFPETRKDLGAERVVFHALNKQLGDDFTVLWSISTFDLDVRQIDFLVLHPRLGVVVIEVKGGIVTLGNPMDPYRKWPATTRAGRPVPPIDNPYQQAQGAGMAFIRDLKANSSFSPYVAITPLVVLPHTPRPPDADEVLGRKAEHVVFSDDLDLLRRRVLTLMEAAMRSGDRYLSPKPDGVASIVELYGRQHTLPPESPEDEDPPPASSGAAPPSPPAPPRRRPAIVKAAGLTAAGLAAALAVGLSFHLLPPTPAAPPPAQAAKPPAPKTTPPSQKTAASLTGIPKVLDTATLSLHGRRLPLAGLRPVDLPEAEAAARGYLAQAGGVTCDLAPVGGWRCISVAKGLDIAEVFALSGYAKAAANAPDFIRNAEDMARRNGMGVWRAS